MFPLGVEAFCFQKPKTGENMKSILLATTLTLTAFTLPTYAAEPPAPHAAAKAMSKEDREEMAKAHEQMAACLRSAEDPKTCHEALHKKCDSMMGGSCGDMRMGKGMEEGKHKHKREK